MKPTKLVITFLCLVSLQTFSQNQAKSIKYEALIKRFYGSVVNNVHMVPKPIGTIIKIDVDRLGKIAGIQLSDSADPDFMKQFEQQKKTLDFDALNRYVKANNLSNISLLIPYYVTDKKNPNASHGKGRKLKQFENKDVTGKTIMLDPIEIVFSIAKR